MEKGNLISVKDFSPEELRKWQLKLLDILVYFRDFCQSHNLRFFLSAGTCLGAVRHHGFIPWDDDVDVVMLREDYEKLIRIWNEKADTSRFVCCITNRKQPSRFPMATIRSVNTTCIYDHSVNDDICQGLKIDVEFLDVVPKGNFEKKIHYFAEGLLGLLKTQRVPKRLPHSLILKSKIVLTLLPTKNLRWIFSCICEKIVSRYNPPKKGDTVRYLTCIPQYADDFFDIIKVEFEGYEMPIPIGYDRYLTRAYGNYMSLPSEKSRVPATDNLAFYDLDHCYLDYKGIYYCRK